MDTLISAEGRPGKPDVHDESQFLSTVYNSASTDVYRGVLFYAGAIWAACRMNAWCFSTRTGEVLNSFSAHEKDLAGFFIIGKCLDYVREYKDHRYPFLLSDSLGMMWIAEYPPMNDDGSREEMIFVFGPAFSSSISPLVITENLDRMNFSFSVRRQLEKVLADVPILMTANIEQYARMLHFSLTGEPCDSGHFLLQEAKVEIDLFADGEGVSYEDLVGTHVPLERALEHESRMLNMVYEGHRNEKLLASARSQGDVAGYVKGNPLRSAKDELIILCTKYMMTAESAGLPPRICRTLGLRYVKLIEESRSLTAMTTLARSMTDDFIERVAEMKASPGKSRDIMIAEDYIRANLTKTISIEDIAQQVGYTDYYLSRKFAKETGMKFADYVNRERVEYAKTLLKTTSLSVQVISDTLQFSGLSYFGRVFKKYAGMTPKEYREKKQK